VVAEVCEPNGRCRSSIKSGVESNEGRWGRTVGPKKESADLEGDRPAAVRARATENVALSWASFHDCSPGPYRSTISHNGRPCSGQGGAPPGLRPAGHSFVGPRRGRSRSVGKRGGRDVWHPHPRGTTCVRGRVPTHHRDSCTRGGMSTKTLPLRVDGNDGTGAYKAREGAGLGRAVTRCPRHSFRFARWCGKPPTQPLRKRRST